MRLAILLIAVTLAPLEAQAPPLQITFIGNEAVQISDGRRTLVSDFPYQSGYSRYMTYDRSKLTFNGEVIALITHRHLDHFEPAEPRGNGWQVVGPREVVAKLPDGKAVSDSVINIADIRIQPVRTPHADVEHYSYRVEWHGASSTSRRYGRSENAARAEGARHRIRDAVALEKGAIVGRPHRREADRHLPPRSGRDRRRLHGHTAVCRLRVSGGPSPARRRGLSDTCDVLRAYVLTCCLVTCDVLTCLRATSLVTCDVRAHVARQHVARDEPRRTSHVST